MASSSADPDSEPDFEPPKLCTLFLEGKCREGKWCYSIHEKEVVGVLKLYESRAFEAREGTLVQTGQSWRRWVPRESLTVLLRRWLLDVGSPCVVQESLREGQNLEDWSIMFSASLSWSHEAASQARAKAISIGMSNSVSYTHLTLPTTPYV